MRPRLSLTLPFLVAIGGVLVTFSPSAGQDVVGGREAVQERFVSAHPIGVVDSVHYQPCAWTPSQRRAMCLRDRLEFIYEFLDASFEGDGFRCRFLFEDARDPVAFRCGELVLALRPGTSPIQLDWILYASEGEWEGFTPQAQRIMARIVIPPGTERSALFNIIFHPDILWVDLSRIRVIHTQPS